MAAETQTLPTQQNDNEVGYSGEGEYLAEKGIYEGRIRFEKLRQIKERHRGERAKTKRRKLEADRQEVLADIAELDLGIEQDNLTGRRAERVINQQEIVQELSGRVYKVELRKGRNRGLRQNLLNEGSSVDANYLGGVEQFADFSFQTQTVDTKAKEVVE